MPAGAAERGKPARDRVFTHIEPSRKIGSVDLDRDQVSTVEAGTVRVEPLQPVAGRKAGLGVVEGKKLPVHGAPGRAFQLWIVDCGLRILGTASCPVSFSIHNPNSEIRN